MSISDINKGASGVNPTAASILPSQSSNSGKVLGTDGSTVSWVSRATLDTTQTFTGAQRASSSTLTDAATIAIDLSLNNDFNVILGGNRTLGIPTNPPVSPAQQTGTIDVRQDATGSRTLAYSWPYSFGSSTAPTLSTGKGALDQLYYRVNNYVAGRTATMTIATPCVATLTTHGFFEGQKIAFTTTGALPTGLSITTGYYVHVVDANTFNLSTTKANLAAGTYIATSGSQSGTHTLTAMEITIANTLNIGS